MKSNTLLEHYKTLLPWNLARTKCFVGMILGMISSGSVQQHKTAIGFSGSSTQTSGCARIRDFLKNFTFNFSDYAKAVVSISQLKGSFDLAIDRTNWQFGRIDINLLVLAMVINQQFAIPLFWKALPKQGSSNADERIDLLQTFIDIFGTDSIGSLMGDREFIGKGWIDFLIQENIPFFIRTKDNRLIEWGSKRYHLRSFFQHLKIGEKRCIKCPLDGHLLYFAGTRSKDGDLVIVISNQNQGTKILNIYRKRWTIELMFGHCKKNGFNLEETHLIHLDRIEKLIAVVGSSLLLCFKAGEREERKKPTPYKKTVDTPAFSTFRRGFDYLRRLLFRARQKALKLLATFISNPQNMTPSL